ncbi:hypothetical protein [Kordiimonas sp. SCSIO 12610]|uniref:hypothetical protein n=1 Tax=Kordiimonas sp. SCSIO 12610 TaxID=2829597 RepID=UPI00210C829D|nr:hypothetical protein [Kordiimonas sp. SCSIO 12610]UTW56631.1 hypothetical protein KFF44_06970 [Kordiimonas sp. SCSIO 12610]
MSQSTSTRTPITKTFNAPVKLLKKGDILLEDLTNASGNLILAKGYLLDDMVIKKLNRLDEMQSFKRPVSIERPLA